MTDPRINALQQIQQLANTSKKVENVKSNANSEISFKEMMKQYLNDANNLQIKADADIQRIIAGEDIDPHSVMVAVEKANLSFELVMEIRNKMLEAYREIMKTQV